MKKTTTKRSKNGEALYTIKREGNYYVARIVGKAYSCSMPTQGSGKIPEIKAYLKNWAENKIVELQVQRAQGTLNTNK